MKGLESLLLARYEVPVCCCSCETAGRLVDVPWMQLCYSLHPSRGVWRVNLSNEDKEAFGRLTCTIFQSSFGGATDAAVAADTPTLQ